MSILIYGTALGLSIALLGYLGWAMLKPERF